MMFIVVSHGNLNATPCFLLTIFPLFLALARLLERRRIPASWVMASFLCVQMFYVIGFVSMARWAAT